MPRLSLSRSPALRRHVASAQGIVTLSGKDHYLGRWPESEQQPPAAVKAAYDCRIAEWLANGRRPVVAASRAPALTIGQLIVQFWRHVEEHYRLPNGKPSSEVKNYRLSFRPLRRLYETLPVTDFGPLKFKVVRQAMVDAGLCRGVVNQQSRRIVRMFKWAVSEELIAERLYRALVAVPGLQAGRCDAKESKPIGPVADADIEKVPPFLLPPVAAMVRLMRLTGMRCGEVCIMRACDLDVTGATWLYRPSHHKTAHRGKARVIALGPKAQEIIRPFLVPELTAFLFSPKRAMEERASKLRAARKTRVQPSQQNRRRKVRRRAPADAYTAHAVAVAIRRACERADRLARHSAENAKATTENRKPIRVPAKVPASERLVKHWHAHQLRHAHATEVRAKCGLDAARTALGHAGASITEIYAERDLSQSIRVAAEVG